MLADEQMIQNVTSVQQLANMETELEQALERVRQRKVCTLNHQNSSVQFILASRELQFVQLYAAETKYAGYC
jgi:hypothetical protein